MTHHIDYKKLFISLLIPQLVGMLGAFFTAPAIGMWYAGLIKPALNPPSWIFAPVWLTLYVLIGIAFYLIWQKGLYKDYNRRVFLLFITHIFLNGIWSILFFGAGNIYLALIDILLILGTLILLMVLFWRIDHRATYLFIPYLAWVSFATYLNYSLLILN